MKKKLCFPQSKRDKEEAMLKKYETLLRSLLHILERVIALMTLIVLLYM